MAENADPAIEGPDPELSIVIPAFNAAATILDQLQALAGQQWAPGFEIIVADNGSTDETAVLVGAFAASRPFVRLITAAEQRGPSYARNAGVSRARGHLVAFCDADDMVGDQWVSAMGEGLLRSVAVTGPQDQQQLNPPWLRNVYGSALATGAQTFAGIFPFGASANLGVRRETFLRFGGFDASLSVGEDIDLCLRLWHGGIELEFAPMAVVHYRNRTSMAALWKQAVRYGAAAPMIARRLAALHRSTPPAWRGLKNWVWLLRRLGSLRSKAGRARWVVVAGNATGRLLGSIRHRHLYL